MGSHRQIIEYIWKRRWLELSNGSQLNCNTLSLFPVCLSDMWRIFLVSFLGYYFRGHCSGVLMMDYCHQTDWLVTCLVHEPYVWPKSGYACSRFSSKQRPRLVYLIDRKAGSSSISMDSSHLLWTRALAIVYERCFQYQGKGLVWICGANRSRMIQVGLHWQAGLQ